MVEITVIRLEDIAFLNHPINSYGILIALTQSNTEKLIVGIKEMTNGGTSVTKKNRNYGIGGISRSSAFVLVIV